jgi:hypothetical protein
LACDGAGNLFVSDIVESSIFKFTPDGTKGTFASGLRDPRDLAFDGVGNLFVSDGGGDDSRVILKFNPDGTKSTFASGLGAWDLAFDRAGNLFVSTSYTIFKFTPDGTKSTFASDWISPDKKWEYQPPGEETGAKIVKAGTKEVAEDLCDISSCGEATVLWTPDSKRFAYNWGQGRTRQTRFYQLRDDQWVALEFPSNDDIFEKQPNDIVAGQLKKDGLSEKKLEKQGKFLRLIWSTMKVDRWLDSNTAIVHVSLQQVAARRDAPGEMDNGYGADLLFTLKFDAAGNWKIVKTHRMSEKEVKEGGKEQ